MKFVSKCVKEFDDHKTTKPHQLPIYATSSFVFESIDEGIDIFKGTKKGHSYSRYANPTIDTVGAKIASLECQDLDTEGYAIMTSSGMSAISTLAMGLLKSGDKILTQGNLYGGTTELFNKVISTFGIESIFTDLQQYDQVEQHLKDNPSIKLIYLETPANPTMACVDIKKIADIAKRNNVISVIDNTFCTPYLQRPLTLGIDFVIHSTTKYLNGHGNGIAGIIVGTNKELYHPVWQAMKLIGTNCNPFDAWLINNGIKTLALRMDKHSSNSMALAEYLENHDRISKVNHLGLTSHPDHAIALQQMSDWGGMMSFEIDGSVADGIQFMNKLQFCTLAPTLGDVDTLVLHPASSSHLNIPRELRIANDITDGMIRISVGIEDISDIVGDVEQALKF